jgi:imidazoleglycerol phosphate dehydratase HisB
MDAGRQAKVSRKTNETQIDLDNGFNSTPQVVEISTGIGFLDHVSAISPQLYQRTLTDIARVDVHGFSQTQWNFSDNEMHWRPLD